MPRSSWRSWARTSVELAQVKAHATEEDVKEGRTTEVDRRGNSEADTAAGKGSKDQQKVLAALAHYFADSHERYRNINDRVA